MISYEDFSAVFHTVMAHNGQGRYNTDYHSRKFYILTEHLLKVSEVMNLTAIKEERAIILKHYADSLSVAEFLSENAKIIDIGCGAGFPCLPLAVCRPDLAITALDSTEKRMKYVLGLTPQVYFDRCVDYQARRLAERMDIPQKVTKKYMHMGYAMHHINSAYLLAQKAGLDIKDVIDLKTPKNSWQDVALKIGLTVEDCREVKNKISKDFGRHE